MSNLTKIIPLGAEVMRTDRQADMTKVIGTFYKFSKSD
jgi:hypothetical protein